MTRFASLRLPALIGLALILPFMILEFVNRREFHEGYPVPLFVILWLLGAALTYNLLSLRSGAPAQRDQIRFGLRLVLLVGAVLLWIFIVADQMPCFLGAPNCD